MPSDRGVALVTGGGRGIGANIARELAADGWSVVVAARTRDEIDAVAEEIGGRAVEVDVERPRVGRAGRPRGGRRRVARRERRNRRPGGLDLGGRPGRVVARARGQRARRASLLPSGDPGHARARQRADRHHRQRRRVPSGCVEHRLHVEQGRGLPLRRDARERAARIGSRSSCSVPGLVRTAMTEGFFERRRAVDAARAGAAARARARLGKSGRAGRPLHPRRARRHRGPDPARRRDRRERPERDPAAALEPRNDPGRSSACKRPAVLAVERSPGIELPTLPRRAASRRRRSARRQSGSSSIRNGEAPEQRLSTLRKADGDRARTVERRPDDVPVDLGRRPRAATSPSPSGPAKMRSPSPASRSGRKRSRSETRAPRSPDSGGRSLVASS